ncbi:WXG100 family type VII secretion target [Arthrobacter sp. RAF14]|uniref:WXG100 family type VII secretion target n=1 Tax=Arthrobacter sp. RAF14 TaxID=3233051 RepID=UPI003F8D983C
MGGGFYGADVAQLRALAKAMSSASQKLQLSAQQLGSEVNTAAHTGPDAARFRQQWQSDHLPLLQRTIVALKASAQLLQVQADEQETASTSPGGTGGGGAPGYDATAAQDLQDRLKGMTPAEREAYLASDEFKRWALEHPEEAKRVLDAAADSGLIDKQAPGYSTFLSDYWNQQAMREMGIDPSKWDPSKGTAYNWEIIKKVYEYYGKAFLADPRLQWAGMANMIGPSFAGGFHDMAMMRSVAQELLKNIPAGFPSQELQSLRTVAALSDAEVKAYETQMLSMNKEIFLDQARQHQAFMNGGLDEIHRLRDAGVIDPRTSQAWDQIASGDPEQLKAGNGFLLYREQNTIIADDYDTMRSKATGPAVTWLITLAGEPSIPGAKSYPEVFPYKVHIESPGPHHIPFTPLDNPLQGSVDFTTGLPDGNISIREDRWNLISKDTLPAYQELLASNPEKAREIIASDFDQRTQDARPTHNIPQIAERIAKGFVHLPEFSQ